MLKALLLGGSLLLTAYAQDAPAPPHRLRVAESVAKKNLKKKVTPRYPQSAKEDHAQGTVELYVVIGVDGTVRDAKLISSPRKDFAEATLNAVKQWKYEPFRVNGQPVEAETIVKMNFELRP